MRNQLTARQILEVTVALHKSLNTLIEFPVKPEADYEAEVAEWLEAFDQVVDDEGANKGAELMSALVQHARTSGVDVPVQLNTPYLNTIPASEEVPYPGDRKLERRLKSLIRWNAMAMVHRQNKKDPGIGGHISTYSSLATLLEVGFNHFFHATYGDEPGDLIYFQGHASPGVSRNSWRKFLSWASLSRPSRKAREYTPGEEWPWK